MTGKWFGQRHRFGTTLRRSCCCLKLNTWSSRIKSVCIHVYVHVYTVYTEFMYKRCKHWEQRRWGISWKQLLENVVLYGTTGSLEISFHVITYKKTNPSKPKEVVTRWSSWVPPALRDLWLISFQMEYLPFNQWRCSSELAAQLLEVYSHISEAYSVIYLLYLSRQDWFLQATHVYRFKAQSQTSWSGSLIRQISLLHIHRKSNLLFSVFKSYLSINGQKVTER